MLESSENTPGLSTNRGSIDDIFGGDQHISSVKPDVDVERNRIGKTRSHITYGIIGVFCFSVFASFAILIIGPCISGFNPDFATNVIDKIISLNATILAAATGFYYGTKND